MQYVTPRGLRRPDLGLASAVYSWGGARAPRTALAVGPTGSDVSYDAGRTWKRFDTGSFDAVDCTSDGACWASGEKGRVARLTRR